MNNYYKVIGENMDLAVLIGNSDGKLSQDEWEAFVTDMSDAIGDFEDQRHFEGESEPGAPWQNACFVVHVDNTFVTKIYDAIAACGARHNQEAVAIIAGHTTFI